MRDWKGEVAAKGLNSVAHQDPGVARWLEISSMISVPLLGRSDIVGIITFARVRDGDFFEESDVAALEDAGRCIGLALEAAELAERNRLVADRFQHAALPKNLPSVPGFTFSAVYQAAKSEAYVGGDWYDAFRLADGQIVLSIGDVIGNGLDAAVTMGAVRQAIRGAAQIYSDPVTVLNAADRALRSDQPNRIVTAFVAVLDPMTLTLRYASAGHPPPMLRTLSGGIRPLTASDLPLGLRDHRIDEPALSLTITEPSLLVLYTDGLTEATHNIIEGEDRLREAMEGLDIFAAIDPAATIHDAILDSNAAAGSDSLACYAQDDVAVLVVRIDDVSRMLTQISASDPLRANWQLDVTDHFAAKNVRLAIADALRRRGAAEKDVCDVELLFSELIGNVIRHAGGMAEIAIDLSSEHPILHVLDRGPGFTFYARLPNDVMSESGRGLFITAMLTRELSVVRRSDGGSHARAVLNCETRAL
jgi:serine phosphatase RsbU (regulator of sigma subunit)/anti-sigma regulatory factor (Ser/Thr protein kinase)